MGAGVNLHDASADRVLTAIHMIDAGSTDRTITQGRIIGPDGHDRVFWDPSGVASFAAKADFSIVYGSSATSTVTTSAVTVTPTGGTAPYFHSWAVDDHTNVTAPTVGSPSAASTSFTQTNVDPSTDDQAAFSDTVTDSATPPNSVTVSVRGVFLNEGHGGTGGIGGLESSI